MPNLNKVILMGNLTREPDLRQTTNNSSVCQIGLAVNRTYVDSNGQRQQDTTFVDAEAWGRTAEVITEYLKKGDPIMIEGRLKLDRWQDQSGGNRSKLKVVVESFQFINARGQNEARDEPQREDRVEQRDARSPQPNQKQPMATAAR